MPFTCSSSARPRVRGPRRRRRARQQHAVERAARPQLVVRARVEHRALVDHDDAIGQRERRLPVRDEDRRAGARDAAQGRVDLLLDPRVDRRRRVVEQEDLRVGEQRARERDPLPLAARQRQALLADDRVVAVGEARMNSCASAARAAASISRASRRAGRSRCWP